MNSLYNAESYLISIPCVSTFLRLVQFEEHIRSLKEEVSVIAGPSSSDLACRIARELDANLVPVDVRIFEDGESKLRVGKTEKKCCIVVQSTYPPTDRHLLQVLMMIKKCADYKVDKIYTVIPYMAYARQDREFLNGEVVSMALVARLLEAAGTVELVTVDIHSSFALSHFTINVQNISSIPILASYTANNISLDSPLVVSPDYGGKERAAEFARILNVDMIALRKFRDRDTGRLSIDERLDTNVEGRDVILIDDMISSGSSIAEACKVLKKRKSGKVYAICAHALLIGNAMSIIKAAGVEDVIATNSVPNKSAKVDLSPVISANLNRLIRTP
jgi:ribose-phosphate pyrophosphokinase